MSVSDVDEAFDEAVNELVVCLSQELKDILNSQRTCWVKEWVRKRDTLGASGKILRELSNEDPEEYRKCLRMTVSNFNELLQLVEPLIGKQNTTMRMAIPARAKLEVTLRYLASGDSFQTLSLMFRIPACTISKFLPEVLQAIITVLNKYIMIPNTTDQWLTIQKGFDVKWNFPNCCGAIDGKHVSIRRPPDSCAEFFNYKGGYSVILLALVDADYRFIYIDVGTNGRANDGSIFMLSTLKAAMSSNLLNWPENYAIVGDDAFPLRENLLKPFSRRNLTLTERVFNYRLSRARRVVENAFGILASRFRVFYKPIELDLKTIDMVVKCACTLHNWLRSTSPPTYFERGCVDYEDTDTGIIHPGDWRDTARELPSINRSRISNCTRLASEKRERLAAYFVSNKGSVPWQFSSISD